MRVLHGLLAAGCLILTATATTVRAAEPVHAGSVGTVRESRAVPPFSAIDFAGRGELVITQGPTPAVVVQGPAALVPRVRSTVSKGTLQLSVDADRKWWSWILPFGNRRTRDLRIEITVPTLRRLEASGESRIWLGSMQTDRLVIELSGASDLSLVDLHAQSLVVDASGAVRVVASGDVAEQTIDISGSGKVDAAELRTDDTRLEISGAGKATVNAQRNLRIDASGAAKVEYLGDPKVVKQVSGVSRISRRN